MPTGSSGVGTRKPVVNSIANMPSERVEKRRQSTAHQCNQTRRSQAVPHRGPTLVCVAYQGSERPRHVLLRNHDSSKEEGAEPNVHEPQSANERIVHSNAHRLANREAQVSRSVIRLAPAHSPSRNTVWCQASNLHCDSVSERQLRACNYFDGSRTVDMS